MVPIIVGIKEFRKNMASITKKALQKNRHILVLNRNTPMLSVRPISKDADEEEFYSPEFMKSVEKAWAKVQAGGKTYTSEEVRKRLGIK